jgi:hypothetical protein
MALDAEDLPIRIVTWPWGPRQDNLDFTNRLHIFLPGLRHISIFMYMDPGAFDDDDRLVTLPKGLSLKDIEAQDRLLAFADCLAGTGLLSACVVICGENHLLDEYMLTKGDVNAWMQCLERKLLGSRYPCRGDLVLIGNEWSYS